ncbi:MAG: outer membrane protein transport protein [Betaproteobacteria bacterium]
MKTSQKLLVLTPVCALFAAASVHATNGYFPHGYGMKSAGMGGAATAMTDDSYGGANNPATMVWAGSRLDLGASWFKPVRDAQRSGATMPTLNGSVQSGREDFLVPEGGYNSMVNNDLSVGVSVYGNGGMNTSYPQGNFNCGGGGANILCGGGTLGVNLIQLIVAPTVSYKFNPKHSVGASVLLGYQRFSVQGIQSFDNAPGFPPFTGAPGSVTNRGDDSATGAGVRVGYMGKLTDAFSVGASYSSKVGMSKFDKYKGLFAGAGGFDIPSNYSVGVAFTPSANWTVAMDYGRINYSGVPAVGNQSMPVAPLGAANGPGFGWKDVNVFKLGLAWAMNPELTLRVGYNKGDNPVTPSNVTFNILAPGVITTHYTAGLTYATAKDSEVSAALMIAPRSTVTGPSLFNGFMGGAAGNETVGMRQSSLGLAYSRKF